jgi:hypothetical protein
MLSSVQRWTCAQHSTAQHSTPISTVIYVIPEDRNCRQGTTMVSLPPPGWLMVSLACAQLLSAN